MKELGLYFVNNYRWLMGQVSRREICGLEFYGPAVAKLPWTGVYRGDADCVRGDL